MGRECCVHCNELHAAFHAVLLEIAETKAGKHNDLVTATDEPLRKAIDWLTILVIMAETFFKALQESKTQPAPPPAPAN